MSVEDLIRKGMIGEKKQQVMQTVIDAKAIVQAILNEAMVAKIKPLRDINTDSILSHATALCAKKEECMKLMGEIRELD